MRGTSGSGKSYIGFQLVKEYSHEPLIQYGWKKNATAAKQVGYVLPGGLIVLGRYNEGVPTGGVDGWNYQRIIGLIEDCAAFDHVYVELRSSFGMEHLQRWHRNFGLTVCYLDTPLETCVEQVYKRRSYGKRAVEAPLNVEAMRSQRDGLLAQMSKYEAMGLNVALIDHKNSLNNVRSIFWRAGWRPG